MRKREFRSCGLIHPTAVFAIEAQLDKAGITKDTYRINYFSNSVELVAEKSIAKKIKSVIG